VNAVRGPSSNAGTAAGRTLPVASPEPTASVRCSTPDCRAVAGVRGVTVGRTVAASPPPTTLRCTALASGNALVVTAVMLGDAVATGSDGGGVARTTSSRTAAVVAPESVCMEELSGRSNSNTDAVRGATAASGAATASTAVR